MAATFQRKRGRTRRPDVLQKPRGVIHHRVQKVGPGMVVKPKIDAGSGEAKEQ